MIILCFMAESWSWAFQRRVSSVVMLLGLSSWFAQILLESGKLGKFLSRKVKAQLPVF